MEEQKEPRLENRFSIDESNSHLDAYEIDPFFGKSVSLDALRGLSKTSQRIGRSESIRNPILTSFWRYNDSPDKKRCIQPEQEYMNIEERGFIRHLMLEGKYDEVLEYISNTFVDLMKEDSKIMTAINWLKFVEILKTGRLDEAIQFGQEYIKEKGDTTIPAVDNDGNYYNVTALDYFSLIAYENMQYSDYNFLLLNKQKEIVADMINDLIIKSWGGNDWSRLEKYMKQLNLVQVQIREERNGLGEIFQFKIQK